MNREDIIRMAEECGIPEFENNESQAANIIRFAALVAKHTLANIDPSSFMTWQEGYEVGKQTEREACAKVCEGLLERPSGYQGTWEGYGNFKTQMTGQECAAAIRARGQA